MLQKIRIQNFKLHKDTSLEIKPITLFIGQNNSGKSSIFQALQLIKQNLKIREQPEYSEQYDNSLIPPKPFKPNNNYYYFYPNRLIDIGNFQDVIRKDERLIGISMEGNIPSKNRVLQDKRIESIQIRYEMKFQNNNLKYHSGEIKGGEYQLVWDWRGGGETKISPKSLKIGEIEFNLHTQNSINQPIFSSGLSSSSTFPYEFQANAEELKDSLLNSIRDFISSIHAIYGLRGFEENSYLLSDKPPLDTDFMLLYDRSLAINSLLPYNRDLESQLSLWFKNLLGVEISFELLPGKTVKIKAKNTYGETSFINEGLGIHQLLFIFLPIALAQPSHTFLIEEPEVHLHPKAQSDITTTFIKIYKNESKQFLIATHSEHILFGFLNALARKEISLDDIAIYYFKNEKGVAEITKLNIDEYGRVSGGLPGFFEQNIRNVIEYLDALDSNK
ncbi:AAA ATPase domain protein [uncultured archaeon]|nr:AAA ATPase domain protein [uncultured archaeon]